MEEAEMFLMGSYPMTVDAKARVTLPSDFRRQLVPEGASKTIVLLPFQGHVNGFTLEGFRVWLKNLFDHGTDVFNPRRQSDDDLKRGILGAVTKVDLDSAGRLALGKLDASRPGTRERLGLLGDVVVTGQEDHFEVWNADKWNAKQTAFHDGIDALLYGA